MHSLHFFRKNVVYYEKKYLIKRLPVNSHSICLCFKINTFFQNCFVSQVKKHPQCSTLNTFSASYRVIYIEIHIVLTERLLRNPAWNQKLELLKVFNSVLVLRHLHHGILHPWTPREDRPCHDCQNHFCHVHLHDHLRLRLYHGLPHLHAQRSVQLLWDYPKYFRLLSISIFYENGVLF